MSSRVHLLRFVRDDASKTKPTTVRCRWVYYVRESSRGEISLVDTQQQIRSFPNDSERPPPSRLRAFLQNAERSRRYHHHHQRSSSSSAKTMMMMIRSSSSSRPTKARACHQKSVLKSKVPLCFFEVFLFLFLPMFFPPFFSKTKKKKEKKKRHAI